MRRDRRPEPTQLATLSHIFAAATSEAEPGPAYILAELISGGNAPKSTTSIILPLEYRQVS